MTNEWNLFDLEKDPNEMRSVHDDPKYASVMSELREEFKGFASTTRLRRYPSGKPSAVTAEDFGSQSLVVSEEYSKLSREPAFPVSPKNPQLRR